MAATYAIPSYVAHLDSGLPESKNPRPRIGLDDEGHKAGYMSSSSRERCDSVCMERGEKPATPPSTWVRCQTTPLRSSTSLLWFLSFPRGQVLFYCCLTQALHRRSNLFNSRNGLIEQLETPLPWRYCRSSNPKGMLTFWNLTHHHHISKLSLMRLQLIKPPKA